MGISGNQWSYRMAVKVIKTVHHAFENGQKLKAHNLVVKGLKFAKTLNV